MIPWAYMQDKEKLVHEQKKENLRIAIRKQLHELDGLEINEQNRKRNK